MASFVLIHGSWHGAWCWFKVETRLRERGHAVIVPDLPSHGRDRTPPGEVTLEARRLPAQQRRDRGCTRQACGRDLAG